MAYYERCVGVLEKAYKLLFNTDTSNTNYDIYRSACIQELEIILKQSGKLIRKILKPYFSLTKEVDKLYFKDVFRHAVLRSIITAETCERWLQYRDSRNNTSHEYGVNFAEETIKLLPQFIADAKSLTEIIKKQNNAAEE